MLGISMSNVDPNMNAPGARAKALGNNPLAYASPSETVPSVFLDIAMSNVASLKVFQARADGKSIPATWIVDKDGVPTTDPSHYVEEGGRTGFILSADCSIRPDTDYARIRWIGEALEDMAQPVPADPA